MAKSTSYFGLRTGSTKSLTFSVVDGKQITKDRVEGGKNPRTLPQMTQRCIVGTIGSAYAAMKSICNHSFQRFSAGMQCMREFMSENLKEIKTCKEYDNGFFGFIKYQQSGLVAGSYIISKGSLPDACPDACITSVSVQNKQVAIDVALGSSTSSIARSLGCRNLEDTCTIAIMYPKSDGFYGFGAVRFTYQEGDTVLGSFAVSCFGDIISATPSYESDTLKVAAYMKPAFAASATTANTYMAAIASRFMNGEWYRSNAQFDVQNARPTFAEAIATYPVGEERILNGGNYGNEASPAPDPTPSGSVAAPTISGTTPFETSTSVTMSGPTGAEIRYTTDGSTPTSSSSLYSSAITLTSTTTVKAIAIKDGRSSEVTTKTFTKSDDDGGGDAD